MICHRCNKYCKSPHYVTCGKGVERDVFKMQLLERNFPMAKLSSGDYIRSLYVNQEMSLPDLSKITGITTKTLYFVLNFFKIKMRTASEANGGSVASSKRAATFIARYGAENPLCAGTIPFLKRNQTVKRKYGVDNVWKLDDVKRKITKTHLQKFGCKRVVKMDSSKINKFESKVASTLIKLGIPFQYSVFVKGRQFDFRIAENVLLECNGSFWHANPRQYHEDDVLGWPGKPVKAKDIWQRDKEKADLARSAGFEVVYVWDDEDIEKVISEALHLR